MGGGSLYHLGVAHPTTLRIRLNSGDVVERPYREAVSLLSRRLADPAPLERGPVEEITSQDVPDGDPSAETVKAESAARLADDYTKAELVKLAEDNGVAAYGTKAEIVARLAAANVELSTDTTVSGATPEDVPVETAESSTDGRS